MKIFTLFSLLCCALTIKAQQLKLTQFSSGYTKPVGVENCGDSRVFIVDETGKIFVCDSAGKASKTPFLDISDRVLSNGEQGLLGLAFDPGYATNKFLYVNYINTSGNTQISRFKTNANYPNLANKTSEKYILEIDQPYSNHNGGCIRFGPDGYLYIGMGDGGSGGDPNNNAQNPQSLLGKMLRIDVHNASTYRIPPDNPFVDSPNYRPEIWATGYRNPWRWSFDALNGKMHIADVGQDALEEIDIEPAGKGGYNYGWRCYEGDSEYNISGCKNQSAYRFPLYEYPHGGQYGECSITGGFVYRGSKYKALYGKYIFADYCSGIIKLLSYKYGNMMQVVNEYYGNNYAYSSFGEDKNHELYVCDLSNGNVYRIAYGQATLTDGIASDNIEQNALNISPNPAKNYVNIAYTSAVASKLMVHITNLLGGKVYDGIKTVNAGTNTFRINFNVPKGNYYLSVITNDGKIITRSLKID